ncbi:MAG: hypothetical protein WBB67_06735 [bacterium]
MRNLLLLSEVFFILAALVLVKLEYIKFGCLLFAIILASIWAIGDFVDKLKKNLKDDVHTPKRIYNLHKIWSKKLKLILYFSIIVGVALYPFVYSRLHEHEFNFQVYRNTILSYGSLMGLIATTLDLLLVILAEKKYGPIYHNRNKEDNS